jgi:hypothetical protein
VYDLVVEGEPKPIGVTSSHPFWSVDRQAWVPVGELSMGERLLARDGSTPRVLSFTLRPEPAPVYNIEVEGDHCYRVGEQGLLVHNASLFKQIKIKKNTDQYNYAVLGQQVRTQKGVRAPNRPQLLKGWFNFGSLVYLTRCDPDTGEPVKGADRVNIPSQLKGSGLIRSDNAEGHVEEKLIDQLERDAMSLSGGGCFCIVEVFTERSPCTGDESCTTLLNSDRVRKLHNTKAKFTVYYIVKWMPDDKDSGMRLLDAYKALGLPVTEET